MWTTESCSYGFSMAWPKLPFPQKWRCWGILESFAAYRPDFKLPTDEFLFVTPMIMQTLIRSSWMAAYSAQTPCALEFFRTAKCDLFPATKMPVRHVKTKKVWFDPAKSRWCAFSVWCIPRFAGNSWGCAPPLEGIANNERHELYSIFKLHIPQDLEVFFC